MATISAGSECRSVAGYVPVIGAKNSSRRLPNPWQAGPAGHRPPRAKSCTDPVQTPSRAARLDTGRVAHDYPGGIHTRENTRPCQAAPSPIPFWPAPISGADGRLSRGR